ncbi:MAG: type IV secretory system conjugative DNA transfer family protein [Neptuniibacter sp.]
MEAFGRFVVAMLRIIALKRSKISGYKRTPTYLIIDEFQNFVSEDLEKALTQLRKYRLYLVLASQYV